MLVPKRMAQTDDIYKDKAPDKGEMAVAQALDKDVGTDAAVAAMVLAVLAEVPEAEDAVLA